MTFQFPVQPCKNCNAWKACMFLGDDRQVAFEVHLSRACVGSL